MNKIQRSKKIENFLIIKSKVNIFVFISLAISKRGKEKNPFPRVSKSRANFSRLRISYYFARTEAFVTRDIGHPEVRGGCVSRIRNFKSSADLDARKAGRVSSGTRELDRSASFLTRRWGRGGWGPGRIETNKFRSWQKENALIRDLIASAAHRKRTHTPNQYSSLLEPAPTK